MDSPITLDIDSTAALYGPVLYFMEAQGIVSNLEPKVAEVTESNTPQPASEPVLTPIQWRPKPASKILFVLHQAELKDKSLGELLKKIVASIGIPFEAAGFGIIHGPVSQNAFDDMPNSFAVVFDQKLKIGAENPMQGIAGEVFFSHRLAELESSQEFKKELWGYLKAVQPKVS